jgi:putative transposase
MIDPTHKLPISRQTKLLGLARSTAYYQPKPVSDSDLALMAAMDRLHLDYPFAGARGLRDILRRQGFPDVGRRRITTLMKRMGIEAIYRKPNTSKRHPGHKIYPYLLRGLKIDRPNLTLPSFPGPLNRALMRPAFAGRQAMPARTALG